jgi:dipeptidase D
MGKALNGLKPEKLWNNFESMCSIPHPSRHEAALAAFIVDFAKKNNLEHAVDDFGNVIVRKPATKGKENLKKVVMQGHLDMVPEKNSDVKHDFEKDPIQCHVEGEWVKAKGTTLGADNAIGGAAALAVLESNDIEHGPIEALFTLDEETGLFGAQALKPGFSTADILMNLDSEEEGAVYIGCAGGENTYAKFFYKPEAVKAGSEIINISITGMRGGHSGMDINQGRGNAVKMLARVLWQLKKNIDFQLISFNGGSKHNAIPRESFAVIAVSNSNFNNAVKFVNDLGKTIAAEIVSVEKNLKIEAVKGTAAASAIESSVAVNMINAVYSIPHGVVKMSADIPGLVETSTNMGVAVTEKGYVELITSQRSSVESERMDIVDIVGNVFRMAGAEVKNADGYPGWAPNINSPVLKVLKDTYKKLYGKEPEIKAIHAGLECGIIKEKYPDMDMISFGPTIEGAHSPDERVNIASVEKFWNLLLNTLKNVPVK